MSGWSDRADAAHRAGQHSYARVCEGRARAAWAREEATRRRTLAEALDDAATPQEFGAVLGGLFATLEKAMDAEREAEDDA